MKGDIIPIPNKASGHDLNRIDSVREGLTVLDPKNESFEERSERIAGQRTKYAAMHAHMEMAAMTLAAGGTFRLAASKAGISVRQVKKYYTLPQFRERIEELRQVMFSKIRGRVIKELEKRTDPNIIGNIELLDLLRVFDRVAGPIGGKAGVNIQGDVNVNNNYDTIIAALLTAKPGGEVPDFPIYRIDGDSLPGESPLE